MKAHKSLQRVLPHINIHVVLMFGEKVHEKSFYNQMRETGGGSFLQEHQCVFITCHSGAARDTSGILLLEALSRQWWGGLHRARFRPASRGNKAAV